MLKFFTYLFIAKSLIMFVLIQQLKDHNLNSGVVMEPDLVNEIFMAVIHPGIFGVVALMFVVVGNLAAVLEKVESKSQKKEDSDPNLE